MATFRLEPVLRLRRHHEERRKCDLAAALAVENGLKDTAMRYAGIRQAEARRFREQQRAGVLDVRALVDQKVYIGLLDREISEQLRSVAQAEHETTGRRRKLADAMVDRKALDVLRDRALAAERAVQDRAETAELDDVGGRMFTRQARA